jgi:hypothetical protein
MLPFMVSQIIYIKIYKLFLIARTDCIDVMPKLANCFTPLHILNADPPGGMGRRILM